MFGDTLLACFVFINAPPRRSAHCCRTRGQSANRTQNLKRYERLTIRPSKHDLYMGGARDLVSPRCVSLVMYQVEKFCGASNGWRPVGRARSHSQASELRRKVEQIRPDFISRVRCVSPELFPL